MNTSLGNSLNGRIGYELSQLWLFAEQILTQSSLYYDNTLKSTDQSFA